MLTKRQLTYLYAHQGLSTQKIATELRCSVNTVIYWMDKHHIARRTISDAVYLKNNPNGDPFKPIKLQSAGQIRLHGLGMGLYWGEGNKANKTSVRLGNTDPELINTFIRFLVEIYGVRFGDLHFGLQIFTDIDPDEALKFWMRRTRANESQFYKITVTISGSIGTYRTKSRYGVLTVYYNNRKLRDILVRQLADVAQW